MEVIKIQLKNDLSKRYYGKNYNSLTRKGQLHINSLVSGKNKNLIIKKRPKKNWGKITNINKYRKKRASNKQSEEARLIKLYDKNMEEALHFMVSRDSVNQARAKARADKYANQFLKLTGKRITSI